MLVRTRQRGQSTVEFGIVALVFVLMIGGLAEFALMLNGYVTVGSTTREAARWAATGVDVDAVYRRVRDDLPAPAGIRADRQQFFIQYASPVGTWTCHIDPLPTGPLPAGVSCIDPGGGTVSPTSVPGLTVPVGATITLMVDAHWYEVFTPFIRPMFECPGNDPHCYVPIKSTLKVRYEGAAP